MQAGQLKVPPGYHPLDVEKEWGKLHVAILEREKQLRSEFERWVAGGLASGTGVAQWWAGGAVWLQGSHPRVSHCLGRKSPPPGWETHLSSGQLQWVEGQGATGELHSVLRGQQLSRPCAHGGSPGCLGCRLECLQRIVSKLQMEAGMCEEQLNQADALLQSVRGRGREGGDR